MGQLERAGVVTTPQRVGPRLPCFGWTAGRPSQCRPGLSRLLCKPFEVNQKTKRLLQLRLKIEATSIQKKIFDIMCLLNLTHFLLVNDTKKTNFSN